MDLKTFKKADELFKELAHLEWALTEVLTSRNKDYPLITIMMGYECKTPDRFSTDLKKKVLLSISKDLEEEIKSIKKQIEDL